MKRIAKVPAALALVLCSSQISNLNAKDKHIGPAAGDVAATNLKMLQGIGALFYKRPLLLLGFSCHTLFLLALLSSYYGKSGGL